LTDAPTPSRQAGADPSAEAQPDVSQLSARSVFGAALPKATEFARWLAGAGTERGLVGPREVSRLWERHLFNCAALSPFLPTGSVLVDIGSGAGLPGLVIAIMRPDMHVICVDPMLRRTTFLHEVADDLELSNVEVRRARAEELAARGRGRVPLRADVVTARAVGSVEQLGRWAAPLLTKAGALVALKGAAVLDEVRASWPMLRRAGYLGPTELFAVELAGAAADAATDVMPFEVTSVATWPAESTGPAAPATGQSVAATPPPMPLATVLRVSRLPQ
jgi:16S rRNA (guanine527-N7)-methyltransferase